MALCICEALAPPQVQLEVSTSQYFSTTKRKLSLPNIIHLIQSQLQLEDALEVVGKFYSLPSGKRSNLSADKISIGYESNGYWLRGSIKNCNMSTVKEIIISFVGANYYDKQSMHLLHLVTLFYSTEIESKGIFSLLYSLM